jgi:EmrB/QacA subfamily drug resistance transporter
MSDASPLQMTGVASWRSPKRVLPWLVAVPLFMEQLDATIVNTAVPAMAENLNVEPLSLKAVMTSYALALAVFIPISGWMADRFGVRRVFATAISLFTCGSLFCALSQNVPMLVASRVVQGLGGSMMVPVGRLALVRTFSKHELLAAINFVVIPALVGPLLGPLVGGVIVHVLPWRTIFLINLPIGVLALTLVRKAMPDSRGVAKALDLLGFLLFGAGIGLFSWVLEIFGETSLSSPALGLMLVASLVLLAIASRRALGSANPVLRLALLRVRTFRAAVLGSFVARLGIGGLPFILPLLLQLGFGFSPWQAGLLLMPQALASMGMKVLAGKILRRFGYRTVLLANTVAMGVVLALWSTVTVHTPVLELVALGFIFGFFSSLQFTSMNSLAWADLTDEQTSAGTSLSSTLQQLSMSVGVALASLLAALYLQGASQADHLALMHSLHLTFLTLGVITVVSAGVFAQLTEDDGANVSNRVVQRT